MTQDGTPRVPSLSRLGPAGGAASPGLLGRRLLLLLHLAHLLLPLGDLALVKGMHELDGGNYEDVEALLSRAERWRPYRGVATRMIWQLYLTNRNRLDEMPG